MFELGKTGIVTPKCGFGALPIQRVSLEDGAFILKKAYEGGITFFDTARAYSDSEKKLGMAFHGMWDKVYVATKTKALYAEGFWEDLHSSLEALQTDHIDLYQFHNPSFCPKPGDASGLYDAMVEAKEKGLVRHIGITNHRLDIANEAIGSGLYETLQFPFSYISGEEEMKLVEKCRERGMGFIAMKGLAGGLLTSSKTAFAFMEQFDNVLPIWGIQRERELDEWLELMKHPVALDEELMALVEADRKELSGEFCRGCGYCMPCPVGIEINTCARMIQLIRRSPSEGQLSEKGQAKMKKIEGCLKCGRCMDRCPYGLPVPTLLEKSYRDYMDILEGRTDVKTKDARL